MLPGLLPRSPTPTEREEQCKFRHKEEMERCAALPFFAKRKCKKEATEVLNDCKSMVQLERSAYIHIKNKK